MYYTLLVGHALLFLADIFSRVPYLKNIQCVVVVCIVSHCHRRSNLGYRPAVAFVSGQGMLQSVVALLVEEEMLL